MTSEGARKAWITRGRNAQAKKDGAAASSAKAASPSLMADGTSVDAFTYNSGILVDRIRRHQETYDFWGKNPHGDPPWRADYHQDEAGRLQTEAVDALHKTMKNSGIRVKTSTHDDWMRGKLNRKSILGARPGDLI